MRQQKIRGHKRRHRHIEEWRLTNLDLRLDLIEEYHSDHIDIVVHPWCDISIANSAIPEPKGRTRQLMLTGMLDIYDAWKKQLDDMGQPYYLKIWLYEPRFSKSEVVCGIGDKIAHYENLFLESEEFKGAHPTNVGHLQDRLETLSWDLCIDEHHFDSNTVGDSELYATPEDYEESNNWFIKTLKKPHRTTRIDEVTELYSFKQGHIWVGGQNNK